MGQGSGIVNACTFLGGFVAVLFMTAFAGIVGAALSRGIAEEP